MVRSERYKQMLCKMGYYNYQHDLIYRHLNQEGGWDTHLANCRHFVLKALDYYKPSKVTILGSGWLLDLPVAEMAEMTDEIDLIDIVHPPEVRIQVGLIHKVRVLEADVTGGLIEEVWNKAGNGFFIRKRDTFKSIMIPEYHPENDPGLIISLNILSQLETLLIDHIRQRAIVTEDEMISFRYEIQKKHLNFLMNYKSVLITDTAEVFSENSGRTTRKESVIIELPEGKYKEAWSWNFDLKGSDYYNKRSFMDVVALIL